MRDFLTLGWDETRQGFVGDWLSRRAGREMQLYKVIPSYVLGSINSHDFHLIGDGKINPIVGVYIPIIRIPY